MDVDKVLINDNQEYFINKDSLILAIKKIKGYYTIHPDENLVIGGNEGQPSVEVYFNKTEGVMVSEIEDVEGKHRNGICVTFRRDGTIRVDDPNQTKIAPAGIVHTYYGVCDQDGGIKLFSRNEKQSDTGHVDHLLNSDKWRGLDTKMIKSSYKEAVSNAIGILKKIPQT